jgi:hypothetical protein
MRPMTRAIRLALPAAFAALAALPAAAESHRLAAAWDAAAAERTLTLDDAHFAALNQVAYHGAVALLCDGFAVDEAELAAATNAVIAAATTGLEAEAMMAEQAEVMLAVGTAHGLFLAEGSLHPERFCADAAVARDDPAFDDHWK